jgi:prepilin-type N-terminal cleavage/methylation domain-containing protein
MKPPRFTLHAPRSTAARGFTILEMLVATGVLAIMVSLLFALFAQGSSAWRQGERVADVNQNMRLALDTFARDAALAIIDTNQPGAGIQPLKGLCVVIRRSPSGGQPSPAEDTQYGHYSDVFFVAPTFLGNGPTNDTFRAMCGIRYYVSAAQRPDGKRSELGDLRRVIFRADSKSGSPYSIYDTEWWDSSRPSGTETNSVVLAENVLSFRIQPLQSNQYFSTRGLAPADPTMFQDLNSDKNYTINYELNDKERSYRANPGLIVGVAIVDRRLADRINQTSLKEAAGGRDFIVTTNWATVYFQGYRRL